jgi:hypothetical protein
MARAKAINVKIATPKIITALEASLAKLETNYATQKENELKFENAMEAWKAEVLSFALDNIKQAFNLRTNYRSYNDTLNIDFDLKVSEAQMPPEPEREVEFIHASTYRESKKELENAIRILKMTDEETVNTSTYNAVSEYL